MRCRWVLTVKRDTQGANQKCKARGSSWLQDRQVWELQSDAPTSTRLGCRLLCQQAGCRIGLSFTRGLEDGGPT
eukprot:3798094-Prorocentrum_lima.AAC.1